jgi:transcriptional regulator with XRE-family HTH domain
VSTNLTIKQRLLQKFRSRKRRRSFAEQDLGSTVAAQIYALRQKHNQMTQKELATQTGMSQARISVLENPNYRKFNVGTLQRVAAAFDVALIVRFVPFGELLDWTVTGSQNTLAPLSFDEEFSDTDIAAVLKPKNGVVVPFRSAGAESDVPKYEGSVSNYSTGGNGQAEVPKSGPPDELNAPASQKRSSLMA